MTVAHCDDSCGIYCFYNKTARIYGVNKTDTMQRSMVLRTIPIFCYLIVQ